MLLKIHGSVNWWGKLGLAEPLEAGNPIPLPVALTSKGPNYKEIHLEKDPYEACIEDEPGDPILAHYGPGKPTFVNSRTLGEIREKAIAGCGSAKGAIIIGVHPPVSPQEDETLWQMFKCLRARQVPTRYIGRPPDTDTVAEMWQFQPVPGTFRDFVRGELA